MAMTIFFILMKVGYFTILMYYKIIAKNMITFNKTSFLCINIEVTSGMVSTCGNVMIPSSLRKGRTMVAALMPPNEPDNKILEYKLL